MGGRRATMATGLAVALATGVLAPGAMAAESVEPAELSRAEITRPSVVESDGVVGIQAVEDCLLERIDGDLTTLRYAGENRYETSVCVSQAAWYDHDDPAASEELKADAVVLARGDLFPDALAGGPLAAYKEAPLLLTKPGVLPAVTLNEIERVLGTEGEIYLLGGNVSIEPAVESELNAAGYTTTRLAGSNRYTTALAIADELPDTSNFFFVTGKNFPDALAAGTAASAMTLAAVLDADARTRPVAVLLTNDEAMPTAVETFVINRGEQFEEWALLTAGGQADAAAAAAFGEESLAPENRFVGANRYKTATKVAGGVFTDEAGELVGSGAGLATALNFPDALAASPFLGLFAQPLLLTHPESLRNAPEMFLEAHAGEAQFLDIFGGEAAIRSAVEDAAIVAFQ